METKDWILKIEKRLDDMDADIQSLKDAGQQIDDIHTAICALERSIEDLVNNLRRTHAMGTTN